LNDALVSEFPELTGQEVEWRSPLAEDRYREYHDEAFLDQVDLGDHAADLATFWPRGGPVWDALAVVRLSGRPGIVLAEGKSYPDELFGPGCQASASSRAKIEAALERTQEWLGLALDPGRWCGRLYQTAKRLAHLYFFNEVLGVRAWFVHLLFVDDPHGRTSAHEWGYAISEANSELGLEHAVPRAGHVLLPAAPADELTGKVR
jgi:hypothetical protein